MRVDHAGRLVDAVGMNARGDETRTVAEGAGIELRPDRTDHALTLKALGAFDDFLFGHVERLPDKSERRGNEWKVALQRAQQLPIPLIHLLHFDPSVQTFRGLVERRQL